MINFKKIIRYTAHRKSYSILELLFFALSLVEAFNGDMFMSIAFLLAAAILIKFAHKEN